MLKVAYIQLQQCQRGYLCVQTLMSARLDDRFFFRMESNADVRSKPYRTRSNRPSIVASFGALRLRCLISLAASRSASLKRGSFTACETRRLLRLAAKVERFCK